MLYFSPKKITKTLVFFSMLFTLHCGAAPDRNTNSIKAILAKQQASTLLFTENRGQVADDSGRLRPDILFTAHSGGAKLFLTSTGINYQFTRVIYPEGYEQDRKASKDLTKQAELEKQIETQTYRFTLELEDANPLPRVRKERKNAATENFYLPQCPDGISGVQTYEKIVYENVYPYIDWVLYSTNRHLKYDFVVRPGGNPAQIRLAAKDAKGVSITREGELLMTTTLGEVREQPPVSYANGKNIPTSFRQNSDGSIGFKVAKIPAGATLIIDPSVSWATYFGGSALDYMAFDGCTADASGNVYISGYTQSSSGIATSGALLTTLSGSQDGYLAKFNSSGALQWATYYGGTGITTFTGCVTDAGGNVYCTGYTQSTTGIATSGAYQTSYAGVMDVLLVKFNSSGARQWGTYYGGSTTDEGMALALDGSGNIFVTGFTGSASGIATSGTYLTTAPGGQDVFVAKFNSSGTSLLWGSYYGGTGNEQGRACATDASGNVYIAGYTGSTSGIATSGAFQTTFGGSIDAFLAAFSPSGSRLWSTYYGGSGSDYGYGIAVDGSANVYLTGYMGSTGMSTTGAYQVGYGGGTSDGYLAKFNSSGSRQWATYFGGSGADNGQALALDGSGNVYMLGSTSSTSGIASGGFQNTYGGGTTNAMVAEFTSSGSLSWASYFGSTGQESGYGIGLSGGSIFIAGFTTSTSGIATSGAYQTSYGGGDDVFLVDILNAIPLSISTGTVTPSLCAGAAVSVTYSITGTFTSGNVFTAQLSDASGSFSSPVTIGSVTGTTAGAISSTIPSATGDGTGYRIRVLGSVPADTGSTNGSNITITALPVVGAITGTVTAVCVLSSITVGDTSTLGGWSSSATGVATVGTTGIVTGVAAGTAVISYSVTNSCTTTVATQTVTVNPLPASITGPGAVCMGSTTTLSTTSAGGSWSSSNTSVADIGTGTGTITGVSAGTAAVTYTLGTGCIASTMVTVNPLPSSITGTTNVCAGLTTTLTDGTTGGTWSSSNTAVATVAAGVVSGVSAGTSAITYTLGTGCIASTMVTVNPLPSSITGTTSVCAGLTTTITDGTTGGAWSSSNTAVATVAAGVVSGVSAGTAAITYTLGTGCIASTMVTVNPLPSSITGTTNVCAGLTTTLTDGTTGGTWSSSNTAVGTVAAGVVSGVSAGTSAITYTLGTGCIASTMVTVNPLPSSITGTTSVCAGLTTTLTDGTTGGAWSSSNTAVATIAAGVVSGVSAGTAAITYTLGTGCIASTLVTVNPLPSSITGTTNMCAGLTTTLANGTTGGAWSSSNTAVATVAAGVVSGVSAGTASITYMLGTGCIASTMVTVNPLPSSITGTTNVCAGLTTTLADGTTGGTWSSSNTAVASVAAGVVSGVSAGTAAITYTLGTGCIASTLVTVNPLPSSITGTTNVCAGLTTTLSDGTTGGTWSSSNTAVATIAAGVVSGVSAGAAAITYTLGTGCIASTLVTVNPLPSSITGTTNMCAGLTTTLADGTTGGAWSSSNTAVATVAAGVVSGVSAGTAAITYTLGTGCIASTLVTVNPLPASIAGIASVCAGLATNLTDATTGGTWSSSNTLIATISTGGTVSGVLAGTATITYRLGTGCISAVLVTVNPLPASITGVANVCAGFTTVLSDITASGTWTSSNTSVANIGLGTGIVNGIAAGTTTITYYLTTGCVTTAIVTVNPLPAPISGISAICIGSATTFSDVTPGGTWTSRTPAVATVNPGTGLVTGISGVSTFISYTLSTGCYAEMEITVDSLPGTITGTTTVCAGTTTLLSDGTSGGTWSSGNPSVAAINPATGLLTGVSAGTTTISYTLGTACMVYTTVAVNELPGAISGVAPICSLSSASLSITVSGGTWTSSNYLVASINPTSGVVTAGSAGTAIITYTLGTGCRVTAVETVNPLPAPIAGPMVVCTGATTNLSDAVTGGSWISGNPSVAAVSAGVVTGMSAGTSVITYMLPTGCRITGILAVNPLPAAITGTAEVCAGLTTTLADATAGGTWSSSTTSIAYIYLTYGFVTGVSAGTTIITYKLGTGCLATTVMTVDPLPAAITGAASVCTGSTTTLGDLTPGGAWISGIPTVATIDPSSGTVTGLLPGISIITYRLGTGCIATSSITVNPGPGAISGSMNTCAGSVTILTEGTTGGTWSSSNSSVATIGLSTGVLISLTPGTSTIAYTLGTGCRFTETVTINPVPASLSGSNAVCVGSNISLIETTIGGTWTSGNISVATVNSTGVVTGVTTGTATIAYMLGTGCMTTKMITVNPAPPAITGAGALCTGSTTTLADAMSGGTWLSSNPGVATVGVTTGVATGILSGTAAISYISPAGCAVAVIMTVMNAPAAITGPGSVCVGSSASLADASPGGTWTSSSASVAGVGSGTGIVNGVSVGSSVITYQLITGCIITREIAVNPPPSSVSGPVSVCDGQSITLSDITSGGSWISSNPAIATVASGSGIVTGVTAGTVTISYTISTGCVTSALITVKSLPAPVSGIFFLCPGSTTTLTDSSTGTWSSSNANVTIGSSTGLATGVNPGTSTISYTLATGCSSTGIMTVHPRPTAFTVTGGGGYCAGGVGVAIGLSGSFTGVDYELYDGTTSAGGVAGTGTALSFGLHTLAGTYTVVAVNISTGCTGEMLSGATVIVNPLPVPYPITGGGPYCAGDSGVHIGLGNSEADVFYQLYFDTAPMGGLLAGTGAPISFGLDTASGVYKVAARDTLTGCTGNFPDSVVVSVVAQPISGTITGPSSVCTGATISLSDTVTGGLWHAQNGTATVNSIGAVTGVSAGADTIRYSVTNICGSSNATHIVSIVQSPYSLTISSTDTICAGNSIDLNDTVSGATWTSNNNSIATVTGTGEIEGIAAGRDTIVYHVTNVCGTSNIGLPILVLSPEQCNTKVNTVNGSGDRMELYPNPNKGIFTVNISSGANEQAEVIITNLTGHKVKEYHTKTNTALDIDLGTTAGIYILSASTGNAKYTAKVIVE